MGQATPQPDPGSWPFPGQRRRFFRVTTRLRFALVPARDPARPWLHQAGRAGAFVLSPPADELAWARERLAPCPRRTISLSEGGMRIRFPPDGPERAVLDGADPDAAVVADALLEVAARNNTVWFRLPARMLRLDPYPWAPFAAFAFSEIPEALTQRLEGLVLAIQRQRLRRGLRLYDDDPTAAQLWRVEAAASARRPRRQRPNPWLIRKRFFP